MTIGSDIAEVFTEVGNPCQIIKSDGSIIDAYFDVDSHSVSSTTFIRQNCLDAVFAYDLDVEQGDVVLYDDNIYALVMNLKPELFQGDIVVQSAYLVQCNTSTGVIYRKGTTRVNYKTVNTWGDPLFSNVAALQYAGDEDAPKELIKDAASIEEEKHALYVSAFVDIHIGDRWMLTPGTKPYQVYAITDRKFEGLHKCLLFEDERE